MNGYVEVSCSKKGFRKFFLVHRLVAMCFIPNPDNLPQVNHIDGNKLNNAVENLEWCTSKQNHEHAKINGLGHYSDERNLSCKQVVNTETGKVFISARVAYKEYLPEYGYVYFTRKLSGQKTNDTPFIYKT